ncbi:MAG TPA: DAK2 domain-containing protein [Pseudogracilibacillus sp.]|nr:DAK2 domain-containing protein [Pseudogracilibacillus sp.]
MKLIDSSLLMQMIRMGARNLANNKDLINKLNVFPVPDGDTGTNMNLSMQAAVKTVEELDNPSFQEVLSTFSRGLLMGARGNSGVILSQLFRGFADGLEEAKDFDTKTFAQALDNGVTVAYASVSNPVEGTILTVAKDTAKKAMKLAETETNLLVWMEAVLSEANRSLDNTPNLLPVLKEVGVVDSGGKGLVVIYEGFFAALKGETITENNPVDTDNLIEEEHHKSVQSFMSVDEIEYGFCTEFFVELDEIDKTKKPFDENAFREQLSEYGDSLLVATTQDMVKIHIHTEVPGEVMTLAQQYGTLDKIDIENMRKQFENIVQEEQATPSEPIDVGVITVAFGDGIKQTFESIGVTTVIEGGQTMNPSTEDIIKAIEQTNAKHTFILPNNKNIILAANQAKDVTDKAITIIPTRSVPQGLSAMFAFDADETAEINEAEMLEAMEDVKTGSITYAIRDTVVDGLFIEKDHFIGLNDDEIKVTNESQLETTKALITNMLDEDDELITLFYGEDATADEVEAIEEYVEENFEDVDIEVHAGKQPIYAYILMVE